LEPVSGEITLGQRVERGERSERGSDTALRRTEHELVAVPMEPQQELVYGWLGLSPALLLDPLPTGDNVLVRVVRPGADAEAVLEEARQQLAAAGSRRRRRGRGGSEGRTDTNADDSGDRAGDRSGDTSGDRGADRVSDRGGYGSAPDVHGWGDSGGAEGRDSLPVVEITPLPIDFPGSGVAAEVVTVEVPARRRRGSSRSAATAALVEAPPLEAVAEAPVAASSQEADDSGEPRRRRRRSSASD
ncbi:MAG: ribonuclease E, partial [Synechococcaceae cyanobacterium ELA263]